MKDEDASTRPGSADTPAPPKPKTEADTNGAKSAGRSSLEALKKLKISGSATPYFIAALVAAGAMWWYLFVFVPQKLDYFVGLRFRTLAVASGQIKSKAENLGLSLNSAPVPRPANATPATTGNASPPGPVVDAGYLRLLVPDIQLGDGTARASALGLAVMRPGPTANSLVRQPASVSWDRVASAAAAASASEFDDLVIADSNGDVVWQREKTTPRLGNLKELVYASDDDGTMLAPSWAFRTIVPPVDTKKELPRTALLKVVRVGATSSLMLVQAVQLESPYIPDGNQKRLYIAGLVSRARLQQQAMRIPLAWLVTMSLPVAVLFLALPFIKLATMNSKERFSVANLILMAIGTFAAAGLAAVIPVGPRPVSNAGDDTLKRIAAQVETNLQKEVRDLIGLVKTVAILETADTRLQECLVPQAVWDTTHNCGLWSALGHTLHPPNGRPPELDVAILMDERGWQVRKWTTKAQLTGSVPHTNFDHYRNLTSGNLWSIDPAQDEHDPLPEFTIEPLRTPTTAEVGVLFGIQLKSLSIQPGTFADMPSASPAFLAVNVRLRSVSDVVMPPGLGFAIVAPDGKVLFHSTDGLALEENFFEEVSNVQRVRERMRNEGSITWSGDYHGVPHRIHMQPIAKLHGNPWKIVTFEDLNPALAAVVKHQNGTFRLTLANFVLLAIVVLCGWWYTKYHERDIRDVMTARFAPDPRRLFGLLVLVILAVAAIAASGRPQSFRWADELYWVFVGLPIAALWVSVFARSGDPMKRVGASWLVAAELGLLIFLVGWVPAAGFARLVERVQDTQAAERWLEVAYQSTDAHAKRAHARAISPAYSDTTRRILGTHPAFNGGADPNAPHFQLAQSPLWPTAAAVTCGGSPESGQRLLRQLLGWSMFSADRRGDMGITACADQDQLRVTKDGHILSANVAPGAAGGRSWPGFDIGWELWLVSMLILAGTIAAAYWAQYRLIPPIPIGRSTFKDMVKSIAVDGNQGIMLIGPPRMRKDQLVKRMVARYAQLKPQPDGSDSIFRIKLLDETVTTEFIDSQLAEVARRANNPGYYDAKSRVWIQVSNLEAQLVSAKRRTAVLGLLEKLMDHPHGEPVRVVVVTTTIDPIAHFQEIFTKEREDFYDDKIPEVQLSRSSLILSRLRRCYMPIASRTGLDPWWNYKARDWRKTLFWEAAGYPPLQEVAKAIKRRLSKHAEVSRPELARTFRSQALAPYDLLWESCTRTEKIVLVQLATEGFITTRNCEVVWGLINKGLIVERPRPTIFNNSFRLFLRHIERDEVVEQWEREDGNGLWVVAGRLIGSSLIAGGLFFMMTQDFSFDSLLPVVSGTGAVGAPLLRALISRVTARGTELLT